MATGINDFEKSIVLEMTGRPAIIFPPRYIFRVSSYRRLANEIARRCDVNEKKESERDSFIFIPGEEEATCTVGFPDLLLLPRVQQSSPRLYQNGCIVENPLGRIRECVPTSVSRITLVVRINLRDRLTFGPIAYKLEYYS